MHPLTKISAALAAAAILAACGGGGGGGSTTPPVVTGPNPTPTASTTTAKGTVISDSSGTPLAGIKVQVDPWIAYPTPGPTPTPIAVSTTDANGHFTVSEPNGTYLLVIGADAVNTPPPGFTTPAPSATDTPIPGASNWSATIHDRIVLNGQTTLIAPSMPPIPLYTPPATETGGSYRIATLDALKEASCVLAYNQERISFGLPATVVDEWLVENSRAILAEHGNPAYSVQTPPAPGNPWGFLTTGDSGMLGGNNCYQIMTSAFQASSAEFYNKASNAGWFAGGYAPYQSGSSISAYGVIEYPIDPRVFTDPNVPMWP